MEIHDIPFDGTLVTRDTQMNGSSAQPLMPRILQMLGVRESDLLNVCACGGFLLAFAATVASVITSLRLLRHILQQRRLDQNEFCPHESSIGSPVSQIFFDETPGFELGTSSSVNRFHEVQNEKRKKKRKEAGTENPTNRSGEGAESDLAMVRKSENWAAERGHMMDFWHGDARRVVQEGTRRQLSCSIISEISTPDNRMQMAALFRPLIESFSKLDEFSQFEGEEFMNMNLRHAWEKGKLKLKQWQEEGLSPNSLLNRYEVVKFWDNLKGRALKTFYMQQGLTSALDSGWMYGIASLGSTSQGILSIWDPYKVTTLSAISAPTARIEDLCVEPSNSIITAGPSNGSGRTELKLWEARIGPRPAALNDADGLVRRRIFNISSGSLPRVYFKHDEKTLSVHDLRMLGSGRIGTLALEAPKLSEKMKEEHDLLSDWSLEEAAGAEEITWWDTDAVIVSDDEENLSDDDGICSDGPSGINHGGSTPSTQSVVSWCLGAVRSISSSLTK